MKTSLLLLAFLLLHTPLRAAPQDYGPSTDVLTIFRIWCNSKVQVLDLKDATFEQAFESMQKEWTGLPVTIPFPVTLTDLENEDVRKEQPRVTMSLSKVPFPEALDLLCKAYGRKLIPNAGPLRFEPIREPVTWSTRVHRLTPEILKSLDLQENPKSAELNSAYQKRGVEFAVWTTVHVEGDKAIVLASEDVHQQIRWVHRLLERGYTINWNGKP